MTSIYRPCGIAYARILDKLRRVLVYINLMVDHESWTMIDGYRIPGNWKSKDRDIGTVSGIKETSCFEPKQVTEKLKRKFLTKNRLDG